ncbi:MAG: VWA domain-containing protein [Candidatus Aminicenantes bacterium]|nr:VWA domain-containing protein [Candidatus Aminicenantes bacterium]
MKKASPFLLILAGAFLSGPSVDGISAAQEAVRLQKPLEHQVVVTLKLIQVYVTDKKGAPVQDLKKEDFVVFDNGREMTLTDFEKHILETAARTPKPQPPEEKIVPTPIPPADRVTVMSRKFFLFFDFAFNNQRGVNKAQEAALHFLDTELLPGDEVGLLSYSTVKGLSIHEYLTTDHKKLREAVAAMNAKGLSGRADDVEQEYWRLMTQESTPPDLSLDVLVRRQDAKSQARAFMLKLTSLAKAFRYIPGRKNLLLFSTGIASSLIYGNQAGTPQGTSGVSDRSKLELPDFVLRTQYEEMYKELSAANCSIFAFDSREAAKVPTLFDYDEQTFGSRSSRDLFTVGGVQQNTNMILKDENVTGLYALTKLSKETGGKYYGNINEYERNMDQLQNLTGSYYILGYSIGEPWNGKFHEIMVEVRRKGVEVRAQSGYYNPKPFAEYSDLEKQLHLFDLALSDRPLFQTPLAFSLSVLSFAPSENGRLEMLSKIPANVLEKFSGKKVEIISLVLDENENLAALQRIEADLTKYKGMDVFCAAGTALAPGNYRCRFVIRDLQNGTGAVASGRAFIPQKATLGLSLHSPLLLVPGSNFLYLEPEAKKTDSADWKAAYPYDRARYSPILGEVPAGTPKIYALVPCSFPGLVSPEIALTAWLIETATGARIPLAGSVLNRSLNATGESILAELSLANVSAGQYRLYLHAADAAYKAVSYTQTSLVIK